MTTVSLSPKFQVVIPKEVREILQLTPGTKLEMIPYQGRIELIPIKPIKELKGAFPEITTEVIREKDRL